MLHLHPILLLKNISEVFQEVWEGRPPSVRDQLAKKCYNFCHYIQFCCWKISQKYFRKCERVGFPQRSVAIDQNLRGTVAPISPWWDTHVGTIWKYYREIFWNIFLSCPAARTEQGTLMSAQFFLLCLLVTNMGNFSFAVWLTFFFVLCLLCD